MSAAKRVKTTAGHVEKLPEVRVTDSVVRVCACVCERELKQARGYCFATESRGTRADHS